MIQDAVVTLGASGKAATRPNHPVRLVLVRCTPHEKTGERAGPPSDGVLRIATNLLEVPAEIIADLYRYRWRSSCSSASSSTCSAAGTCSARHARDRDPNLPGDHRLPAVDAVDRRQADVANLRDGLSLSPRLGRRRGATGASRKTQTPRRLSPLTLLSAGSLHAVRQPTGDEHCATLNIPLLTIDIDITGYITLRATLEPNRRGSELLNSDR